MTRRHCSSPPGSGRIVSTWALALVVLALLLPVAACQHPKPPPAQPPEISGMWGIRPSTWKRPGGPSEEIKGALPPPKKSVRRIAGVEDLPPLPATVRSVPRSSLAGPGGRGRVISFKDAPLSEVVSVFADLLGIRVITPPNFKGTVTLHSGGAVRPDELMPLFETILETNHYALVYQRGIYRVLPLNQARRSAAVPMSSAELLKTGRQPGFGLEVFYLKYLSADRALKSIRRFISKNGDISSVQPANALIVAESQANLAKVRRLIALLDVPISRRVAIRVYHVENVTVKNLARDLRNIFKAMGISQKPRTGVWADVVPLPDLKSIAVISSVREMFRRVESWLDDLDRQMSEAEMGVYVYHCQSGEAKDIAAVLTALFGVEKQPGKAAAPRPLTPQPMPPAQNPRFKTAVSKMNRGEGASRGGLSLSPQAPPQREAPSGTMLEGGVRIVVEPATNSIVIRAPRRMYHTLLSTIQKLDVFPRQVLIEVLIAEVTLDDAMHLGVEWHNFSPTWGDKRIDTNLIYDEALKLTPASGLIFTITQADRLKVTLRALAEEGKVNIISAPLLLSSDGQESTINVGEEVPIITDITTSQDLSQEPSKKITDRSIKYRDIGIILSVTPRINDSGLVRMQVDQEITDLLKESFGDTGSPSFFKRTASTSVITTDSQSIVIAGLIKERTEEKEAGIPWLKDIPLLGYLFKAAKKVKTRTELVITLTPHVIHDMADAKAILEDLRDELRRVRQPIRRFRGPARGSAPKKKAPAPSPEEGPGDGS